MNESRFPTIEVDELIAFAVSTLEGDHCNSWRPPKPIHVIDSRRDDAISGVHHSDLFDDFVDDQITVRIAPASSFPLKTKASRAYLGWTAETWEEAVVGLVAHEATHSDQYRRMGGREAARRLAAISGPSVSLWDRLSACTRENEADRAALLALKLWREGGREIVAARIAASYQRQAQADAKKAAERAIAAAAAAYRESAAGRAERVRALLPRWERRAKAAKTRIAKLAAQARRYGKLGAAASALQAERSAAIQVQLSSWERRSAAIGRKLAKLFRRLRGLERSAAAKPRVHVVQAEPSWGIAAEPAADQAVA